MPAAAPPKEAGPAVRWTGIGTPQTSREHCYYVIQLVGVCECSDDIVTVTGHRRGACPICPARAINALADQVT